MYQAKTKGLGIGNVKKQIQKGLRDFELKRIDTKRVLKRNSRDFTEAVLHNKARTMKRKLKTGSPDIGPDFYEKTRKKIKARLGEK